MPDKHSIVIIVEYWQNKFSSFVPSLNEWRAHIEKCIMKTQLESTFFFFLHMRLFCPKWLFCLIICLGSAGSYVVPQKHCWKIVTPPSIPGIEDRRERDSWTDRHIGEGERGKVWTVTQGHEPHGDGEGRKELLIWPCGISYDYHRIDRVFPPWASTPPPDWHHSPKRGSESKYRLWCIPITQETV